MLSLATNSLTLSEFAISIGFSVSSSGRAKILPNGWSSLFKFSVYFTDDYYLIGVDGGVVVLITPKLDVIKEIL